MDNTENPILVKIKKHYKLITFVIILMIIALFTAPFAIVRVDVNGEQTETSKIELYQKGELVKSLKSGINIIRTGKYSLRAESGDKLTEASLNLQPFRLNKVSLDIKNQNSIKKVVTGSLGCVYSAGDLTVAQAVYTYTCDQTRNVFRYSAYTSGQPSYQNIYKGSLYSPTVLNDGLIGITPNTDGGGGGLKLVYMNPENPSLTNLDVGPDPTNIKILTLSGDQVDEFVVADQDKKKLVYYKSVGDTNPQKVDIDIDGDIFGASSSGESVFVYGAQKVPTKNSNEDTHDSLTGGVLSIYSVESGKLEKTKSIKLSDDQNLYGVQALDNETVVTRDLGDTVTIYKISGKKLVNFDTISEVSIFTPHNNGLVFCRQSRCFEYDVNKKTSYLVHEFSSRVSITDLQSTGSQLVVSVLANGTNNRFGFVITDDTRVDGIEQVISYPAEVRYITSIDYNDNSIFVKFALTSVTSDAQTGIFSFSPEELADKKAALADKLSVIGIDAGQYKIISTN